MTVTDTNGCTDIDNVKVEVFGLPTPSVVGPAEICNQGTADLVASGGASYLWSEGSTTALIAVSPSVTSTYSVTVTIYVVVAEGFAFIVAVVSPVDQL